MALIGQEVSAEREIEIPDPVREAYALYRPSPLYRAHRLERALDTPAHIYYKYEGVSPAGSHKPNTAIPQAFYNKRGGRHAPRDRDRRRPVGQRARLRRGALRPRGQGLHGPRQLRPEAVPAQPHGDLRRQVVASPSPDTNYGRRVLAETPDSPGSLGIAISEAVEDAATRDDTQVLARLGAQPRAAAPDGHRPGGDRADGDGRRGAGHHHRLRRRRLELRRPHLPVPRPEAARRGRRTGSSPSSRRPRRP